MLAKQRTSDSKGNMESICARTSNIFSMVWQWWRDTSLNTRLIGYSMSVTPAEGHKTSLASFWTSTQKGHLTTVVVIIATSTSINSKLFLLKLLQLWAHVSTQQPIICRYFNFEDLKKKYQGTKISQSSCLKYSGVTPSVGVRSSF